MDKVVLHIGGTSSRCGACNKPADPYEDVHEALIGYGEQKPGCGARYTHVSGDYIGAGFAERVKAMRPDLEYLSWEK